MAYPQRLIPQPQYRILNFDEVISPNYYLIRHTETQDILDELGQVKPQCVANPTDNTRDLSCNLLGLFQPEDIMWKWAKDTDCATDWTPGTEGVEPVINEDVIIATGRGALYLQVTNFHNYKFTIVSETYTKEVECIIKHSPSKSNFWHCALRWIMDGEDVNSWSVKNRRPILAKARSIIINNALLHQPNYEIVPHYYFQ